MHDSVSRQNDQDREENSFEWCGVETNQRVAIGNVPSSMAHSLNELMKQVENHETFYDFQKKKCHMVDHFWIAEQAESLQEQVSQIRDHPFWSHLRHDDSDQLFPLTFMDEIYFSRPPTEKVLKGRLYGTNGNFRLHKDGAGLLFPGCRLYRILIGLSSNNFNTMTCFPSCKRRCIDIDKGNYVIFDFSRTSHEIITLSKSLVDDDITQKKTDGPPRDIRILMKLHFLCMEDRYAKNGMMRHMVENIFYAYETITRYVMAKGTNPTTFYEYILGVLCECLYFLSYSVIIISFFIVWFTMWCSRQRIQRSYYITGCILGTIFLFFTYVIYCYIDDRWVRRHEHVDVPCTE